MKKTILGIIAIIIVAVIVFWIYKNKKQASVNPVRPAMTPTVAPIKPAASPTVTIKASPTQTESPLRAKIRSDFISKCNTTGHQTISVCNCVADYLAANYSDIALAKMYLQYHSTNQVPAEIKSAVNSCSK